MNQRERSVWSLGNRSFSGLTACWLIASALAFVTESGACAQDSVSPATEPAPTPSPASNSGSAPAGEAPASAPSSVDEPVQAENSRVPQPKPEPRRVAPVSGDRVRPAAGNLAGVVWEDDLPPAVRLLPEGTALVERRGRLRILDNGSAVFVFDADESGRAEAPMLLLPCLKLMEMRRTVEARTDEVSLVLSGRVTVSHGRNYMLPEFFTTIVPGNGEDGTEAGAASVTGAGASPGAETAENASRTGGGAASMQADPSAEAIIEELGELAPIVVNPGIRRDESDEIADEQLLPPEATSLVPGLRREGDNLVSRQGRLIRSGAGSWLFAPESDASSAADQPMVLLPCLLVEEMERAAQAQGDRIRFLVSGRVFVYEDRNYLLPTMYLLETERGGNLIPAQ